MLQIAANWIKQETKDIAEAKKAYIAQTCPAPSLSGDQATLMVRDEKLHHHACFHAHSGQHKAQQRLRISLVLQLFSQKCQITSEGFTKLLQLILRGTCMSEQHFITVHPTVEMFQSGAKRTTNRPTLSFHGRRNDRVAEIAEGVISSLLSGILEAEM